jgi:protein-tyrosine phosphatase
LIPLQPVHGKFIRLLDLTKYRKDVPDPFYTGDFDETYRLVSAGCRALLNKTRSEQNL